MNSREQNNLRKKLLDAGVDIFIEKGFKRARLDEIAAAAGATRGAVYYHFGNKEELLKVIIYEYKESIENIFQVEKLMDGCNIMKNLASAVNNLFIRIEEDLRFRKYNILFGKVRNDNEVNYLGKRFDYDYTFFVVRKIIIQAEELGELKAGTNINHFTLKILASISGIIENWLLKPEEISLKKYSRDFTDLIFAGCLKE